MSSTSAGMTDGVYASAAALAKAEFRLNVGDTYRQPPPPVTEFVWANAKRDMHLYAPTQGEPALLDAIQQRLAARGSVVDRDCIQVMPGATGGLSIVSHALLERGDEVLLLSPFWPLIHGILRVQGVVPVEVPFYTRLDEPGFDVTEVLTRALTPRTAAIYVNTPNNPTGRMLSEAETAAIAQFAETHGLWVLADDVYEDLVYEGTYKPIWHLEQARTRSVVSHSLSKTYGVAGLRVGFTHGPRDAMQRVRAVQLYQSYCAPHPMQVLATRVLAESDGWLAETRELYARAGRKAAMAVALPTPRAGAFLFFDASPYFAPGEDLAGFLGRCLDKGVLLTNGKACGKDYTTWIRLCYTAVPEAQLDVALERLRELLVR
jgi:N-succinyldiaminopimelate aminotransferase